MYSLYDWVYNARLNIVGIISEINSGRCKSEYAIYFPGYTGAHKGNGYSINNYKEDSLWFYTDGLMADRIVPFNPMDENMMNARNISGVVQPPKIKKRKLDDSFSTMYVPYTTTAWPDGTLDNRVIYATDGTYFWGD